MKVFKKIMNIFENFLKIMNVHEKIINCHENFCLHESLIMSHNFAKNLIVIFLIFFNFWVLIMAQ